MVCNRIYSVCLCFSWIAVFYFQCSHRVRFRRRCGFGSHLLLGRFVSAHTDLPVLMCRSFGCRFLPAFLHRHHHPRLRIPRYSSSVFFTILSLPFRMSRSISSHRPYFPSNPLRQCRFFGVISAFTNAASFRFFFSV